MGLDRARCLGLVRQGRRGQNGSGGAASPWRKVIPAPDASLPTISPRLLSLFRVQAIRYAKRSFHAIRVARGGPLPALPGGPVIIIVNHPSWWDPLIGIILSTFMPPDRGHYAPIEAKGLAQYRFLAKLGFFAVETGTAEGARAFLRTSLNILSRTESVLWITPQGEFVDPRIRPVTLKDGVGILAYRLEGATIIPLALEYPFWNDRAPEALAWFGEAIPVPAPRSRTPAEWTRVLGRALEESQDQLAAAARARDPELFTPVVMGSSGVGGVYDAWRRFRAMLARTPFEPEHRVEPKPTPRARSGDDPFQPDIPRNS